MRRVRPRTGTGVAVLALVLLACGGTSDGGVEDGVSDQTDASTAADGGSAAGDDTDASGDDTDASGDDTDASGDDGTGERLQPSALEVVATVAPIADLVAVVGGDRVEVTSLVPAGADAHTYEPRPRDVVSLSDADAYLGVGLDLNEGALRLARENLPAGAPIVLLGERLLDDQDLVFEHSHGGDDHGHSHGGDDHDHSHGGDDHGHSHRDDDAGHSHGDDGLGPNPHVWTSIRNAALMVDGIAEVLGELDPDGSDVYTANAAAHRVLLEDLDERVASAVSTIPEDDRVLVTYHDAWSYFARDHDLTFATAIQPADFSEPSAGELRALIDQIRVLAVPTVFGSEVFPTPVLEAIAEETDTAYVGDLSDDVLPGAPGEPDHTYLELMRRNSHAIVTGLGGDASTLDR